MERKRKLPARAAARVEQASKRRQSTPLERSDPSTPSIQPQQGGQSIDESPAPPTLPTSVQPGKPLPTVEDAQPEDLSSKDYRSLSESNVLAESLSRSRQKWTNEGLFEKFWTKPHKKKGVLNEDPKNPPKDSMTKVGTVTITIEPHIIEATMYTVKDTKAKQQQQQAQPLPQKRPIIQYGPPNGSMPPPRTTASASASASPAPDTKPVVASLSQNKPNVSSGTSESAAASIIPSNTAQLTATNCPPRPPPSVPASVPQPSRTPSVQTPIARPPPNPPGQPTAPAPAASTASTNAVSRTSVPVSSTASTNTVSRSSVPATKPAIPAPTGAASKPSPNDPVIALLAQKASGDPELRDLMKRVAVGQAKEGEIVHFQKIIDQLNAEYRQKGGQQGPSADRLLVDGKTVKYFADEVRNILDIVLASNPNQKSSDLKSPPTSDEFIIIVVKTALEDTRTRDMIRRIADGRPGFNDATDLKEILDRLHRDMKTAPQKPTVAKQASSATGSHGLQPNGHIKAPAAPAAPQLNPQALRSKGPLPTAKPDVSAVCFDFGTGDRYLFPKFTMLEYLPTHSGQQVVASFLIVRKGSFSEYGGDPNLDYYQPVTMRLYTHAGRHLENLARVVAPQDEVLRYMDDVMDNMTRAEYVLLAMRLPRTPIESGKDINGVIDGSKPSGPSTPLVDKMEVDGDANNLAVAAQAKIPPVFWASAPATVKPPPHVTTRDAEADGQAKYRRLVNTVAAKDTEVL